MPRVSKSIPYQVRRISGAWEKFRPTKAYSGLTLEQFHSAMQPALESHERVRELKELLRLELIRRSERDDTAREIIQRIVHAVKGEPEDGENSAIYGAMGFMLRIHRRAKQVQGRRAARRKQKQTSSQ